MGTQVPGRKRIPNREKLTAEDDALSQIAREVSVAVDVGKAVDQRSTGSCSEEFSRVTLRKNAQILSWCGVSVFLKGERGYNAPG